jgi:hypothetical protein
MLYGDFPAFVMKEDLRCSPVHICRHERASEYNDSFLTCKNKMVPYMKTTMAVFAPKALLNQ